MGFAAILIFQKTFGSHNGFRFIRSVFLNKQLFLVDAFFALGFLLAFLHSGTLQKQIS